MPTSGRPSSRAKRTIPSVGLVLLVDPVLLDLEVDLLGAEGLDQVVEVGAGVVVALFDQAAAEARLQAAGEDDHALGVRGEQLHVDVRLAAREALEEAGRGELDQVGEAGVALGQQGQVVALVADLLLDRLAVVDEVGLEADDRLDPVLAAGLVEVDGAVHHAVVGEARGPAARAPPRAPPSRRSCRRRRAASTRCGRGDGRRRGCSRRRVDHAKRGRCQRPASGAFRAISVRIRRRRWR